jgi:hypothetical protein
MRTFVAAALAVALLASAARAQTSPFAADAFGLGPTAGTLGVGVEGSWRPGAYLGLRLDASALPFDYSRSISGIPYKFSANLRSGGPVLDVYPFGGGFRLWGGVRVDGNKADITSTPASSIRIGSNTYTPAEVGTLSGKIEYNHIAPAAGIGYAGRVTYWLELGIDAGVLYQGKPRVSLAASGSFASNPMLQADIDQARRSIQSKINASEWWPVLMVSALFHF